MKQLELTKEERENIKILLKIGNSILEIERKIIELEARGQYNEPEYKSVINALKSSLTLEENLLSKLFSSSEKIVIFFNEYGDPYDNNGFNKQLETWITPTKYNLTITRLINYFYNKIVYEPIDKNINIQAYAINTKTGNSTLVDPKKPMQLDEIIKTDIIYTLINLLSTELRVKDSKLKFLNDMEKEKEPSVIKSTKGPLYYFYWYSG